MKRRHILALPLAGAASSLARPAGAQSWPARPVRLVVPYPAGQATDIFGRRFAEFYQRRLGQPFVVENRAGAGGNIGSALVAHAEPDGYTLLWGTNATHAANEFMFASLGFDPVADFAPIAVQATYICAVAILAEAALSFIGAGVPPSTPSWGNIMAEGRSLWQIKPYIIFFPALFLSITVLAINMLGDGLRDALDPRMRKRM